MVFKQFCKTYTILISYFQFIQEVTLLIIQLYNINVKLIAFNPNYSLKTQYLFIDVKPPRKPLSQTGQSFHTLLPQTKRRISERTLRLLIQRVITLNMVTIKVLITQLQNQLHHMNDHGIPVPN